MTLSDPWPGFQGHGRQNWRYSVFQREYLDRSSDGWAKNQLGERRKDVWANYFLGDRRLGDKLGWYGDSKLDGWATLFRRLGEMCERGENQN